MMMLPLLVADVALAIVDVAIAVVTAAAVAVDVAVTAAMFLGEQLFLIVAVNVVF